jgi:hypothetical protein
VVLDELDIVEMQLDIQRARAAASNDQPAFYSLVEKRPLDPRHEPHAPAYYEGSALVWCWCHEAMRQVSFNDIRKGRTVGCGRKRCYEPEQQTATPDTVNHQGLCA